MILVKEIKELTAAINNNQIHLPQSTTSSIQTVSTKVPIAPVSNYVNAVSLNKLAIVNNLAIVVPLSLAEMLRTLHVLMEEIVYGF